MDNELPQAGLPDYLLSPARDVEGPELVSTLYLLPNPESRVHLLWLVFPLGLEQFNKASIDQPVLGGRLRSA